MRIHFDYRSWRFLVTLLVLMFCPVISSSALAEDEQVESNIAVGNSNIKISSTDKRPVLLYCYKKVPFKPYLRELYTPNGVNILRDAPHDHLHHHALMFAVKVDGANFWEEAVAPGRQVHREIVGTHHCDSPGKKLLSFSENLDWISKENIPLLRERRTITQHTLDDTQKPPVTLITWASRLEPAGDKAVTITGSHYHGLGMRFLESMDSGGTFINSSGKAGDIFRGTERLVQARWCAYQAKADGKPVTVAMFDHPKNKRPVTWFTMTAPFAYLSATLRYHELPLEIQPKQALELCYGIAIWDGYQGQKTIEQLYQLWLSQSKQPDQSKTDRPALTKPKSN